MGWTKSIENLDMPSKFFVFSEKGQENREGERLTGVRQVGIIEPIKEKRNAFMGKKVMGRFAPSPSGRMHLGNLFCSLLAWLSAHAQGGEILLRVEDLDRERCPEKFSRQLEQDFLFLGLTWQEGGSLGGPRGPYFQGERSGYYRELLNKLEAQGLVYPCFCSRAQLHSASAPHASDGDPVYTGACRGLSKEEIAEKALSRKPALRLRVPNEAIAFTDGHYGPVSQNLALECGDFILRRSDGVFAYQLAVVGDDGAMGVTQVVRGRDLLSSTPRQLYLYRLLGLAPPEFYHTPLLLSPEGRRLSKRDEDLGLDALREKGLSGPDIVGRLAFCAGLLDRPEPARPQELLPLFSWEKVPLEDVCLPRGLF